MSDKNLKFGVQMDALPSPGMERMVKQYSAMVQKASNVEGMIKGMDKYIKKDKELAKAMAENSNKALKEKDKLLEQINKKTQRSMDLFKDQQRQERLASYMAYRETRSRIEDPSFLSSAQGQRYLAGRAQAYQAGIAQTAMGSIQTGLAVQDSLSSEAQEQIKNQRQQRLMAAGVWLQAAGAAANVVADVYGFDARKLQNEVASRSLAGNLYNEISNADYTTLDILQGGGAGKVVDLANAARAGGAWRLLGRGAAGVGKIVTGGVAASAGGPLGAAYGAGSIVSGVGDVGGAVMGYAAGDLDAEMARGAQQAIELMKQLNPVRRRQLQDLMSRQGMIQEVGALSGGIGSEAWKGIVTAGIAGGLTDTQSIPLWMQLRHGVGTAGAGQLLETAAASTQRYGIDRSTATGALIGLSGLSGGASQAEARLETILARAFRAGLKDTAVQGALATALPGMMSSVAGRGSGIGAVSGLVSAEVARAGGDMAAVGIGLQGLSMQGTLFGTASPIRGLANAQAGNIAQVASQYGLSRTLTLALVKIGDPAKIGSAQPGSPIYDMVAAEAGAKTPEVLAAIRSGAYATTNAFAGGMLAENAGAAYTLLGGAVGGTGEGARAAFGIAGGPLAGGDIGFRVGESGDQRVFNAAARGNALNQMLPTFAALNDSNMVAGLENLAKAGSIISVTLDSLSKSSDLDKLGSIPGILNAAAVALQNVANVAAQFTMGGMAKGHVGAPASPTAPSTVASTVTGTKAPNSTPSMLRIQVAQGTP